MASGSTTQLDASNCRSDDGQPVILIGPHPPFSAATGMAQAVMSWFSGSIRWAVKWELLLLFFPVIVPFMLAGAGYPLVRESKRLSRFVLRFARISEGVVAIFPDGTRPGKKKGAAAIAWLRSHKLIAEADVWLSQFALPRPGGVAELLRSNPQARVVLQVTSFPPGERSVPADFWALVFGPATVYKVWLIDLDRTALDEALATSEQALGRLLIKMWVDRVFPLLRDNA